MSVPGAAPRIRSLAGLIIVVLLLAPPSAWAAPIVYQNYSPPFFAVRLTDHNFTTHKAVNLQTASISRTGHLADAQNSSTIGNVNATAELRTRAWFFSAPYSIAPGATSIHVNSSGNGSGRAEVRITCANGVYGVAWARFDYSVTVGLWDRNTSSWVGARMLNLSHANTYTVCTHAGGPSVVRRNLTLSWSIGVNPLASAVNSSHSFQIVTVLVVTTRAVSYGSGNWATSVVDVGASLARMQGYYY